MYHCPICLNKSVKDHCVTQDWTYKECKKCRCLFLVDFAKKVQLNSYYKKEFTYELTEQTRSRIIETSRGIISKLISFNSDGKKLLDIGSGHGYLLEVAKEKLIDAIGIEPSRKLYNETKNRHSVQNMNIDDFAKDKQNKFDFITLVHVLEHLNEPNIIPDQLSSMLNINGIVLIETPNYSSWLRFIEKCRYTFLTPPDHTFIFSEESIRTLFSTKYWEVLSIKTYSYPEHFIGILLKLKLKIQKLLKGNYSKAISTNKPINGTVIQKKNRLLEFLAPLLTPTLNLRNHGSIVQIYLKKVS